MFQETNLENFLREVEGGNFMMGGEKTHSEIPLKVATITKVILLSLTLVGFLTVQVP